MQYQGGKSRIARSIADIISLTGGENPMRYQGGKSRISAQIARLISARGGACFVSLFCGSCAVESKVQGFSRKILNDKHAYLIAMLRGVQNGYELPELITPDQYQLIKAHKDWDPVLAGFVGFGCSFGGKWFGGYARNATGTNYALQNAEFVCGDYRHLGIPPGSVIYADPPYNNTTGYGGEVFDTAEFWRAMQLLADTGHAVFVSEQEAPPGIVCVWERPFTRTLDRNKSNQFKVTEKLFYLPPRRLEPCT